MEILLLLGLICAWSCWCASACWCMVLRALTCSVTKLIHQWGCEGYLWHQDLIAEIIGGFPRMAQRNGNVKFPGNYSLKKKKPKPVGWHRKSRIFILDCSERQKPSGYYCSRCCWGGNSYLPLLPPRGPHAQTPEASAGPGLVLRNLAWH